MFAGHPIRRMILTEPSHRPAATPLSSAGAELSGAIRGPANGDRASASDPVVNPGRRPVRDGLALSREGFRHADQ